MRSLDDSLPLKLLKAREAVMDQFRPRLHAHGVTEQQWRVLRALNEHKEMDAGALSKRVAILMPSLSRILNDLEKRGLLKKERSSVDKRLLNTRIRPKGRALVKQIAPHSETQYNRIEQALGKDTYRMLMSELDNVIRILNTNKKCAPE